MRLILDWGNLVASPLELANDSKQTLARPTTELRLAITPFFCSTRLCLWRKIIPVMLIMISGLDLLVVPYNLSRKWQRVWFPFCRPSVRFADCVLQISRTVPSLLSSSPIFPLGDPRERHAARFVRLGTVLGPLSGKERVMVTRISSVASRLPSCSKPSSRQRSSVQTTTTTANISIITVRVSVLMELERSP